MGISILSRALPAAYGAALRNAQKGGMDAKSAEKVGMFLKNKMKRDEALSVLNLQDMKGDVDFEMVQKVRIFVGICVWCLFSRGRMVRR